MAKVKVLHPKFYLLTEKKYTHKKISSKYESKTKVIHLILLNRIIDMYITLMLQLVKVLFKFKCILLGSLGISPRDKKKCSKNQVLHQTELTHRHTPCQHTWLFKNQDPCIITWERLLTMLKKVRGPVIQIHTKTYWGLLQAATHPPSKFRGYPFSSLCLIR